MLTKKKLITIITIELKDWHQITHQYQAVDDGFGMSKKNLLILEEAANAVINAILDYIPMNVII